MCASNPKKKKQYATKETKSREPESKLATDDTTSQLIDEYVGKTILTKSREAPVSTAEAIKGKSLIGFYFAASWCQYSKDFTPKLIKFYEKVAKPKGMEIIYISSDNDKKEFEEYFATMPWLAMDGDKEGAINKHKLATKVSAFKIPHFLILNMQTGTFVTDQARLEVLNLEMQQEGEDPNQQTPATQEKEYVARGESLIQSWLTREPETIGSTDGTLDVLARGMAFLLKNPIILVGIVALLILTPTISRMKENPLLAVAAWFVFKRMAKQPLSRNEPYMVQEAPKGYMEEEDKKKKN